MKAITVEPLFIGLPYAWLSGSTDYKGEMMGEYDRCFEWLQTAYERKNPALCLIKGALFKHVQNLHDLRYNELLISMNLTID